jgi:hypothetical protein
LGASVPGVIQVDKFFYYTFSIDLFTPALLLNITDENFVTQDVISVTGFVPTSSEVDALYLGGPVLPDFGYYNDLMFSDDALLGDPPPFAPNIFCSMPNRRGTDDINWDNTVLAPWQTDGSNPVLINAVPESASLGWQFQATPQYAPNPPFFINKVSGSIFLDTSNLPDSGDLNAVNIVLFVKMDDPITGVSLQLFPVYQHMSDGQMLVDGIGIIPPSPTPFLFFGTLRNNEPIDGAPWLLSDWKSNVWQVGAANHTSS